MENLNMESFFVLAISWYWIKHYFFFFWAFIFQYKPENRFKFNAFTSACAVRVVLGLMFQISECAQCCPLLGRFCWNVQSVRMELPTKQSNLRTCNSEMWKKLWFPLSSKCLGHHKVRDGLNGRFLINEQSLKQNRKTTSRVLLASGA